MARPRAGLGLCPCDGFPAGYWLLNAEEEKARLEMPRGGQLFREEGLGPRGTQAIGAEQKGVPS